MKRAEKMVGGTRIELVTPCVSSKCSTAELTAHIALENDDVISTVPERVFQEIFRPALRQKIS